MQIVTQRLLLEPFSLQLIAAALSDRIESYADLGYIRSPEWPEPDLREALPVFLNLAAGEASQGYGGWIILLKQNREIVGSTGFVGMPDTSGSIEIGFGIVPSRRRCGYCFEAACALRDWGIGQQDVRRIVARCSEDNIESQKIIRKLGFTETGKADGFMEWEYRVNSNR